MELSKGANTPISHDRLRVTLTHSGELETDIAALLCGSDGKVRSDDDFVFYNQPMHRSQSVSYVRPPGGGSDFLEVDLALVENEIEQIVISASVYTGDFGRLANLTARVIDARTDTDLICFQMSDATTETAMIAAEIYRRNGAWKLRAIGQGYASGLGGVATDYGISIDEGDLQQDATPPVPQQSLYGDALVEREPASKALSPSTSPSEASNLASSSLVSTPPLVAASVVTEGLEDLDNDTEVTLQTFPTDNPFLKRIFTMKEFGRAPGRAIAVYRERVIDPDEKMIAAFKSKHGQYKWGYIVLTSMCLRWFQTLPVRDEELWSWDDVGLNGSVVVCEGFQYQLKGFGAGRKFKALMMVLAQADGWEDSRR